MSSPSLVVYGMLILVGSVAGAQQPTQFKANVKIKNGADGTTSSGTMYFGGAKMRTELTMDGQSIVVLADPMAKSQYVLMPSEKTYMQMPIGQGPVSIPITGPSDPTNPCGGGSGNTDCVRGPNESVNGYDAVRWDYTSTEGVRTRAWVSTRLRFPVKSQDDNGSSVEFSNIAEGPQAAGLFAIPTGFKRGDIGAMGGMGVGRGRSNASEPVAAAMANMSPQAAAAMAAAKRGDVPRGTVAQPGSGWEKGKGWVINVTVTGTATSNDNGESGTRREIYTPKIVASIPLNFGSPAAGVVGAPGPMWQLIVAPGMGSPEALAAPLTLAVEADGTLERVHKAACGIGEDPYTETGTIKTNGQRRVTLSQLAAQPSADLSPTQALFKIAADLKTYDLLLSVGTSEIKEATEIHIDGTSCRDKTHYTKTESSSATPEFKISLDLKGLPLPSAVGPVTGSKKMPMSLGGRQTEATVNWTLTPIR